MYELARMITRSHPRYVVPLSHLILIAPPVGFDHALIDVVSNREHIVVHLSGISRIKLDPWMAALRWQDVRVVLGQYEAWTYVIGRNKVDIIRKGSGTLGRKMTVRVRRPVRVHRKTTRARWALNVCGERPGSNQRNNRHEGKFGSTPDCSPAAFSSTSPGFSYSVSGRVKDLPHCFPSSTAKADQPRALGRPVCGLLHLRYGLTVCQARCRHRYHRLRLQTPGRRSLCKGRQCPTLG